MAIFSMPFLPPLVLQSEGGYISRPQLIRARKPQGHHDAACSTNRARKSLLGIDPTLRRICPGVLTDRPGRQSSTRPLVPVDR